MASDLAWTVAARAWHVATLCWVANVTYLTSRSLYKAIIGSVHNVVEGRVLSKLETQILFFPDDNLMCKYNLRNGGCRNDKCKFNHNETSLESMIKLLQSAKRTLDVCVFTISCYELADVVLRVHKRGVVVRVITDDEQMDLNCSQVETFRREGIDVRHDNSSYFMHHKFAIVDCNSVLSGSFNWTRQAITGNHENVLITNMRNVVEAYQKEFEKLWISYDPEGRKKPR